ncbi:MAG: hypothetical protein Q7T45_13895 [Bradyrhizobium sp.]|uniref:hypothetical protein n=1 Tax=Bradyrhizobium sp. TaxID=376 RepID=UPI00271FA850|nr:hypothetical protein [Bradyrhizobium sp.]MDO8398904.1 hypothetical protein [Bradyrhizobium sp.]
MKKDANEQKTVPVDWSRLIASGLTLQNAKISRIGGTVNVDGHDMDGMVQNVTFSGGEPGEISKFLATVDVVADCDGETLIRKFKHDLTVVVRDNPDDPDDDGDA